MVSARESMAVHRKSRDLVSIGAYQAGSNPQIDRAIELHEPLNEFLRQDVNDTHDRDESWRQLREIMQTNEPEPAESANVADLPPAATVAPAENALENIS